MKFSRKQIERIRKLKEHKKNCEEMAERVREYREKEKPEESQ